MSHAIGHRSNRLEIPTWIVFFGYAKAVGACSKEWASCTTTDLEAQQSTLQTMVKIEQWQTHLCVFGNCHQASNVYVKSALVSVL